MPIYPQPRESIISVICGSGDVYTPTHDSEFCVLFCGGADTNLNFRRLEVRRAHRIESCDCGFYDFLLVQLEDLPFIFLKQSFQVIHAFLLLLSCRCGFEANIVACGVELEDLRPAFFVYSNKDQCYTWSDVVSC